MPNQSMEPTPKAFASRLAHCPKLEYETLAESIKAMRKKPPSMVGTQT
jgi:hypothetical protein